MYREHSIALVIPAYNEAKLIRPTLENVPSLFDRVFVVDDASPDNQNEVIQDCKKTDPRIELISHSKSQGPGGAIISGYRQSGKEGYDITVVIGGDYQMDLSEVENFLDPIVEGRADYTKGNRFLPVNIDETIRRMPRLRLFANWVITALTKIASGFFSVADVVDGYTAISLKAVQIVNWDNAWKRYGYPMDFLVRLNAYGFRVLDVPRTAIYIEGERQSQIKGISYALKVSPMLLRSFLWRLRFRYLYLDFHPLVVFYALGSLMFGLSVIGGGFLVVDKIAFGGMNVTASRAVLVSLLFVSGLQFLLFAMLFDREESKSNLQAYGSTYHKMKPLKSNLTPQREVEKSTASEKENQHAS